MVWSNLQANSNNWSSVTSATLAYNYNVGNGNLLVAAVTTPNNTDAWTVTDSQSNTWTKQKTKTNTNSPEATVSLWTAIASASGANTVTITAGGLNAAQLAIAEFSSTLGIGAIDGTASNSGQSTSSPSTGSIAINYSGELALTAFVICGNSGSGNWTFTPGSGFTNLQDVGVNQFIEWFWLAFDYQINPSSGTVNDAASLLHNENFASVGISIRYDPNTEPTGGEVLISGESDPQSIFNPSSSGEVLIEGGASPQAIYSPSSSGTVLLGGSATVGVYFLGSGTVLVGGSAAISQVINSITTGGKVLIAGGASPLANYSPSSSGTVLLGGSAKVQHIINSITTGGTVLVGGSATVALVYLWHLPVYVQGWSENLFGFWWYLRIQLSPLSTVFNGTATLQDYTGLNCPLQIVSYSNGLFVLRVKTDIYANVVNTYTFFFERSD